MNRLYLFKSVIKAEFLKVQTGQVVAKAEIRDPELVRMLEDIAAKQNLKIEDILKGVQAFDERYVWDVNPKTKERQLRQMILVSGAELDEVIDLLQHLFGEQENPKGLKELADSLIVFQSGESEENVREMKAPMRRKHIRELQVKHGFSFVDELSAYLGYSDSSSESKPDRKALMHKLQKKLRLLEDLRNEKVYKYEKLTPDDDINLKRSERPIEELVGDKARKFERGEKMDITNKPGQGGKKEPKKNLWYWVDFEREWP